MKELAMLCCLTAVAAAQEFEVASIHRAVDDGSVRVDGDKGYYRLHNYTVKMLIGMGWGVNARDVIGGPAWIGSDRWDITAKMPAEYATRPREQFVNPQDPFLKKMIQTLLADRFRLVIHREAREVSGLALVVAKNGPKMTAAAMPEEDDRLQGGNSYLKATNFTMKLLAQILSGRGTPVVDKTGLTGGYDFELSWAPPNDTSGEKSSLSTAVEEQLGLKLETAKIPIEAVVVGGAEKPDEN